MCYSNRSKVELLGVTEALLAEHGAVSEPVAQAMAEGARTRAATDVGIGITGIAGPDGGTPDKPVGTVAIAVDVDGEIRVRTFQFIGGREQVKFQASQAALNMLRLMLDARDGLKETVPYGWCRERPSGRSTGDLLRLFVAIDLDDDRARGDCTDAAAYG